MRGPSRVCALAVSCIGLASCWPSGDGAPGDAAGCADLVRLPVETYHGAFEAASFVSSDGESPHLVLFGTSHVTDLEHPQFKALQSLMDEGEFAHVLLEQKPVLPPSPGSDARIVRQYSEFGFVVSHYRDEHSVLLSGIDPARELVVRHLLNAFEARQIQTAFTLRRMASSSFRRLESEVARRAYIARTLAFARAGVDPQAGGDWFETADEFLDAVDAEWPGLDLQTLNSRWFSPLQTSAQTGSHFINDVIAGESLFRSRAMYQEIAKTLARYPEDSVLVIVGSGHAYAIEGAAACLAKAHGLKRQLE